MHQQQQFSGVQRQLGGTFGVVDLLHALQLGEMIAATDGAQRTVETAGRQRQGRHTLVPVLARREVQIAQALVQLVGAQFANGEIRAPQRHAAADVAADQGRAPRSSPRHPNYWASFVSGSAAGGTSIGAAALGSTTSWAGVVGFASAPGGGFTGTAGA